MSITRIDMTARKNIRYKVKTVDFYLSGITQQQ